jgi:hypothetical protein
MDRDNEAQVATQRYAHSAGLLVAFFMVVLAGMTVLAVANLFPLFEAVPFSPPEASAQK